MSRKGFAISTTVLVTVLALLVAGPVIAADESPPGNVEDQQFAPGPPLVPGSVPAPTGDGDFPLSEEQAAALEQMSDIHEIRPPVAYGLDPRWTVGAAVAGLLAVVVGVLWWLRRRATRRERAEMPVPVVPPEVLARESLAALAREAGLADKEFYFRLCATVREYLDRRFQLDTLEMTTEELSPVVRRLPLGEEIRGELLGLFRAADPIRYADATAGVERRRTHLSAAESVVTAAAPAGPEGG